MTNGRKFRYNYFFVEIFLVKLESFRSWIKFSQTLYAPKSFFFWKGNLLNENFFLSKLFEFHQKYFDEKVIISTFPTISHLNQVQRLYINLFFHKSCCVCLCCSDVYQTYRYYGVSCTICLPYDPLIETHPAHHYL